eukprot:426626_1
MVNTLTTVFILIAFINLQQLEGKFPTHHDRFYWLKWTKMKEKCIHANRVCYTDEWDKQTDKTYNLHGAKKCCKGLKCMRKQCIDISDSSEGDYDESNSVDNGEDEFYNINYKQPYYNQYEFEIIEMLQLFFILLIICFGSCCCGIAIMSIFLFIKKLYKRTPLKREDRNIIIMHVQK